LVAYDLFELATLGLLAPDDEEEESVAGEEAPALRSEKKEAGGTIGPNRRRVTSMKRDILFLERGLDLLKPGGRMAIVLPQGNLNNLGLTGLRDYLLGRARLLAVVGLHYYTFRPFASIKTSVVFVQKWDGCAGPILDDYPVFMAVSTRAGKDNRGRYIYKTDSEGRLLDSLGHPVVESNRPAAVDTDLEEIADAFLDWQREHGVAFS
jgi:type I restriction enzyme M protein